MFNIHLFNDKLSTSWLGRELFYFPELESTNSHAKRLPRDAVMHGALVLADHQSAGKGQHQRIWSTQANQNLTFTLVLEPKNSNRLSILTLACALAIVEFIDEKFNKTVLIKWPNDVLVDGKKICGLLTETVFKGEVLERLIIGIGLNVNQQIFEEPLSDVATSLKLLNDNYHERESVLSQILTRIEYYYRLWSTQNIELVHRINKKIIGYGEWTQLEVDGQFLEGEFKFLGINENGHLLVLNKELEVNTFSHEQVRVRFDPSKA